MIIIVLVISLFVIEYPRNVHVATYFMCVFINGNILSENELIFNTIEYYYL